MLRQSKSPLVPFDHHTHIEVIEEKLAVDDAKTLNVEEVSSDTDYVDEEVVALQEQIKQLQSQLEKSNETCLQLSSQLAELATYKVKNEQQRMEASKLQQETITLLEKEKSVGQSLQQDLLKEKNALTLLEEQLKQMNIKHEKTQEHYQKQLTLKDLLFGKLKEELLISKDKQIENLLNNNQEINKKLAHTTELLQQQKEQIAQVSEETMRSTAKQSSTIATLTNQLHIAQEKETKATQLVKNLQIKLDKKPEDKHTQETLERAEKIISQQKLQDDYVKDLTKQLSIALENEQKALVQSKASIAQKEQLQLTISNLTSELTAREGTDLDSLKLQLIQEKSRADEANLNLKNTMHFYEMSLKSIAQIKKELQQLQQEKHQLEKTNGDLIKQIKQPAHLFAENNQNSYPFFAEKNKFEESKISSRPVARNRNSHR